MIGITLAAISNLLSLSDLPSPDDKTLKPHPVRLSPIRFLA
ncbi:MULTISPECIES: hypothetical protein [Sphingobium]|uniref:Uncharacterized protein n=1 Tax=Sphingobium tyrosinilyticum TaxID=2715436 RepID=A0ABV9F390_9SPHN|nr:hypothetical protein [Sphingobium sp. EP60837]ANI77921.1 hypothetical protein EP837_01500 [Sphingobium sp. EP60837]